MQPCPRQKDEATLAGQLAHVSHWREDETCSYCGSLSPELLFLAIAAGCELGPTDKNYKVYVDRPARDAGTPWVYASQNFPPAKPDGWLYVERTDQLPEAYPHKEGLLQHWVRIEPKHAIRHDKFYFQHLSVEQRHQFIELLNTKQLKIGSPGYFYVPPFFMRKVDPA